ncbi:hypothetical protein OROHE_014552 [Orobanche hederae]
MEPCITRMLREMNRLSNPPTWVGSSTDIAECIRALEEYQPDSLEDLEQMAITEIGNQIPELRNIFRYERGTQQKRDDSDALTSLFEYAEYELQFQCPPNSPSEIFRDVPLNVLTPRLPIRRLSDKFYSNVRARTIVYYTGDPWNQSYGYLDETPGYNPLFQDYDTVARRHVLERAFSDFYCLPNLADYVFKRELDRCSIFTSSGLLRWFGAFSNYIIVIAFLILHLPFSVISMVTFFSD